MYDIQNALRRRALADRLEALSRASEETARAGEAADTPTRPRHLAPPPAAGPPIDVTPTDMTPPPTPRPPAQLGSPYTPTVGVVPPIDRLLAIRTMAASHQTAQTPEVDPSPQVAQSPQVGPSPQTEQGPRYDVPLFRADQETAHLFLGADPVVPPGVTLLREAPFEPDPEPAVRREPAAAEGSRADDVLPTVPGPPPDTGRFAIGDLFAPPVPDDDAPAFVADAPAFVADAPAFVADVIAPSAQTVPVEISPVEVLPEEVPLDLEEVPLDEVWPVEVDDRVFGTDEPTELAELAESDGTAERVDETERDVVLDDDFADDDFADDDFADEAFTDEAETADAGEGDQADEDDGASPAVAIADLLRRGGSGLFFQR